MTEHRPPLTLVVTAHHRRFLAEALTSVAAQTTGDFELALCADTTYDPTLREVFDAFAPFLVTRATRVFEVQAGTAGAARNAGFAAARGPWLAYLDGDDLLRPDAVEQTLAAIRQGNADMISSGMWRIDGDGGSRALPRSLDYRPPRWIYHRDPDEVGHATYVNQFLAIRMPLWQHHPFDESTNGEDIDFMLHQLLAGRFAKLPAPLYGHRDVPGSFSKRTHPDKDLCTRRYQQNYYAELFAERYRPELAANFSDESAPRPAPRTSRVSTSASGLAT